MEYDNVKINILDTPGTAEFVGESRSALQVAEAAILVVDSVDGVQIETAKAWRYLNRCFSGLLPIHRLIPCKAAAESVINSLTLSTSKGPILNRLDKT